MTDIDIDTLYANRRESFNNILDGYEIESGFSLSGAEAGDMPCGRLALEGTWAELYRPGKWALVSERPVTEGENDGYAYFVTNVVNRIDVDTVAARDAGDGWQPVCFFDLDVIAEGEEMPVRYGVAKIVTVVVFNTVPSP